MSNTIILKDNQADQIDVYHYPDGQKSVCLKLNMLDVKKPVTIKCRIRNFSELEVLIALIAALKRNDFYLERIEYIYLFGMRSDRAFKQGEPSYFKDVLLPILKSFNEAQTAILAPHNEIILHLLKAEACYIRSQPIIPDALQVGGDEGSYFLEESFSFIVPQWSFKKRREENSIKLQLSTEALLVMQRNPSKPILIYDDLCDAGGTFVSEAQYLREVGIKNPLKLFVAHGLFTKGLEPLLKHFDHIYCTNSYQDINHPRVTQLKVI